MRQEEGGQVPEKGAKVSQWESAHWGGCTMSLLQGFYFVRVALQFQNEACIVYATKSAQSPFGDTGWNLTKYIHWAVLDPNFGVSLANWGNFLFSWGFPPSSLAMNNGIIQNPDANMC